MNEINVIISALEKIMSKSDTRNDWDDMLDIRFKDKRAEKLRHLFWDLSEIFPGSGSLYSAGGMGILKAILEALKREQSSQNP
jgi:hypothetical protein